MEPASKLKSPPPRNEGFANEEEGADTDSFLGLVWSRRVWTATQQSPAEAHVELSGPSLKPESQGVTCEEGGWIWSL